MSPKEGGHMKRTKSGVKSAIYAFFIYEYVINEFGWIFNKCIIMASSNNGLKQRFNLSPTNFRYFLVF